ncbi:hypothetical protein LY78DRAFT_593612, partial [Colletotrichum sublineola]
ALAEPSYVSTDNQLASITNRFIVLERDECVFMYLPLRDMWATFMVEAGMSLGVAQSGFPCW